MFQRDSISKAPNLERMGQFLEPNNDPRAYIPIPEVVDNLVLASINEILQRSNITESDARVLADIARENAHSLALAELSAYLQTKGKEVLARATDKQVAAEKLERVYRHCYSGLAEGLS